jgi:XTP/dITP diphosphohydrolase
MNTRSARGAPLVVASHNPGKVREIAALLDGLAGPVSAASDHGVPEPEETGETFAENAALKAHAVARATGRIALADDSGLVIPALDGAPGIYSARWAGPSKDFAVAMDKVFEALGGKAEGQDAHFACALCLAWPDGHEEAVQGTVHGALTWPPRGDQGFGYDPIFVPSGYRETFGEMPPAQKHAMSHRAEAFAALKERCF